MFRPLGLEHSDADWRVIKFGSRALRIGVKSAHPEIFRLRWDAFLVGRVYPNNQKKKSALVQQHLLGLVKSE